MRDVNHLVDAVVEGCPTRNMQKIVVMVVQYLHLDILTINQLYIGTTLQRKPSLMSAGMRESKDTGQEVYAKVVEVVVVVGHSYAK